MTEHQIQVKVSDADLKAHYANAMQVHATPEEFALDFFAVFPPAGALVSRVVMSPGHLKRAIAAMTESLNQHEQRFGAIKAAEEPKGKIGFHTGVDS